jgi:hypothetical protein
MNATQCHRENELLDALGNGLVGAELAMHVAECISCSELHLVAGALLHDRVEAVAEAPVPSAGTMWWRMQLRRRQEAQAATRRSLVVGQAMTLSVAIALVVSFFGMDLASGVRETFVSMHFTTPPLLLLVALGSWLLIAPIAGWVAMRQK